MTEQEREMDLMIAELEVENRMMRERNGRLERELHAAATERDRFKEALERILAISRVAVWDGKPQGATTLGKKERECND